MPKKSFDEVEEELTFCYGEEARLLRQIKTERGYLSHMRDELEKIRGRIAGLEKIKKQQEWDA